LGGRPGSHDEHVEVGIQALRRAPGAPDHVLGVPRQGREREQALADRLRAGLRRSRAPLLVASHDRARLTHEALHLHVLGHLPQSGLAQRCQVLDLEEVVKAAGTRTCR